jgi:hypothetical protein
MTRGPTRAASADPDITVIVPVNERPVPLGDLYREYSRPLREAHRAFEFLFVVEPWGLSLTSELAELANAGEPIRILHGGQTLGEAGLLKLGAGEARGSIVVTHPSYHRIRPEAVMQLVEAVEAGADVAVARRWPRRDSWINRLQNRLFHAALGRVSATPRFHDIGCGVRALRRGTLEDLPLYGDFSRFLPLLAAREGYAIREVDTPQHERDQPSRVYSPGVYVRRAVDLLGLFFLLRFIDKPLRFFGLLGSALIFAGSVILGILLVQRLGGQGIADRPMLLLGALGVVMGIQAVAVGLVGEIIVHLHATGRPVYRLARRSENGWSVMRSAETPSETEEGGPPAVRSDIA